MKTNEMRVVVQDKQQLVDAIAGLKAQGVENVVFTPTHGPGTTKYLTLNTRSAIPGADIDVLHLHPPALSGNPLVNLDELSNSLMHMDLPEVEFHFDGDKTLTVQKTDGGAQVTFEVKF